MNLTPVNSPQRHSPQAAAHLVVSPFLLFSDLLSDDGLLVAGAEDVRPPLGQVLQVGADIAAWPGETGAVRGGIRQVQTQRHSTAALWSSKGWYKPTGIVLTSTAFVV